MKVPRDSVAVLWDSVEVLWDSVEVLGGLFDWVEVPTLRQPGPVSFFFLKAIPWESLWVQGH